MRKIMTTMVLSLCVCLLSGCMAMSTPKLDMSYKTKPKFNVKSIKAKKSISNVKGADLRGTSPFLIGSDTTTQTGPYGIEVTSTSNYLATKPLINTIAETFNHALFESGYKLSDRNPDYILKVNLLKIKTQSLQGMFSANFNCSLTLQVQLQNAKTDQLVWKRTFVSKGKHHVKTFAGFSNDQYGYVRDSFHKALNNIIKQLLTSGDFRSVFS